MSVYSQSAITGSFLELLRRGTKRPIGDARIPTKLSDDDQLLPYGIVLAVPGTLVTGSLADVVEDAEIVYQVTSVGLTRAQCEGMADLVRRTVCARSHVPGEWQVPLVPPDGWVVNGRLPQDGSGGGVIVEGEHPHLVFSFPERYLISVTAG